MSSKYSFYCFKPINTGRRVNLTFISIQSDIYIYTCVIYQYIIYVLYIDGVLGLLMQKFLKCFQEEVTDTERI